MADVRVNSVEPATVGPDMIAYLLTVSVLNGSKYEKSINTSTGLPIITGCDERTILVTYGKCRTVVDRYFEAAKYADKED